MKQPHKMKWILVSVMLVAIVGVAINTLLIKNRAQGGAEARALSVLQSSAHEQEGTFQVLLESQYTLLEVAAAQLDATELQTPQNRQIINGLQEHSAYSQVTLTLPDGSYVFHQEFMFFSSHFTRALAGERGMAYQARRDGNDQLVFSVPVQRNGQVVAVLTGYHPIALLQQMMVSHAYDNRGFSVVVDGSGRIIVNAETPQHQIAGDDLSYLRTAEFENDLTYEGFLAQLAAGETGMAIYTVAGQRQIMVYVPLAPEQGWMLCNEVPAAALQSEVDRSWMDMYVASATSLLFALLAVMLLIWQDRGRHRQLMREADNTRRQAQQLRIVVSQNALDAGEYDIAAGTFLHYRLDESDRSHWELRVETPEKIIADGNVLPESAEEYRAFFRRIDDGKSPLTADFQMRGTDGGRCWMRFLSTTVFDNDGFPRTAVISYHDCTVERERAAAHAKWQQEMKLLTRQNATVHEWNLSDNICLSIRGNLFANAEMEAIADFDERVAAFSAANVHPEDRAQHQNQINRQRLLGAYHSGTTHVRTEFRIIASDNATRWARITVHLVPYPDSESIKAYLIVEDIEEEKRWKQSLLERSRKDTLTGLLNRDAFLERFTALLREQPEGVHALLMLDIDGFKQVNDKLGHGMGDQVLRQYAADISSILRTTDLVGRIGGDEFVICLPDIPFDAAIARRAGQLCNVLSRRISEAVGYSTSIGIAVYGRDGYTFEELYTKADRALYTIKSSGKNGYAFFEEAADAARESTDGPQVQPLSGRRRVLIASEYPAVQGAVRTHLDDEYEVLCAGTEEEIRACMDHHWTGVDLLLLDADSEIGLEVLRIQSCTNLLAMLPTILITACTREKELLQLQGKTLVSTVISKPVSRLLLRFQVRALLSLTRQVNNQLQHGFHRLQQAEEHRFRTVLNTTGTVVFSYDPRTKTFYRELVDPSSVHGDFTGHALSEDTLLQHLGTPEEALQMQQRLIQVSSGERERAELQLRLQDAEDALRWKRLQILRVQGAELLMVTFFDINDLVETNEKLRFRAERDALTGIYNRPTFLAKAEQKVRAREPGYYVMACFDINGFKVINDNYGTEAGDRVLQHIARSFAKYFPAIEGLWGRAAGDNFIALYPAHYRGSSEIAAIRAAAADAPALERPLTFSIGCYVVNDLALSAGAMLDRATIARMSIKGRYGTQIAWFDESMRRALLDEQEIISQMESALAGGQFHLWIQPQFNHATGGLVGAEVLVRWLHPEKGMISPGQFIPLFERSGFIYVLDRYIWRQACLLLRSWLDAGYNPAPLSVNVSRWDMLQSGFYETVSGLLDEYALHPSLLRLEITESAFAGDSAQIMDMVCRLREYGFILEIDDFGSGYSSLNVLKDVPADVLKLDMRFLSGGTHLRSGIITESVISMAHQLGMPVIAEGVETREQADYLLCGGCTYVQGYLYARPMPAQDYAEQYVHTRRPWEDVGETELFEGK